MITASTTQATEYNHLQRSDRVCLTTLVQNSSLKILVQAIFVPKHRGVETKGWRPHLLCRQRCLEAKRPYWFATNSKAEFDLMEEKRMQSDNLEKETEAEISSLESALEVKSSFLWRWQRENFWEISTHPHQSRITSALTDYGPSYLLSLSKDAILCASQQKWAWGHGPILPTVPHTSEKQSQLQLRLSGIWLMLWNIQSYAKKNQTSSAHLISNYIAIVQRYLFKVKSAVSCIWVSKLLSAGFYY